MFRHHVYPVSSTVMGLEVGVGSELRTAPKRAVSSVLMNSALCPLERLQHRTAHYVWLIKNGNVSISNLTTLGVPTLMCYIE